MWGIIAAVILAILFTIFKSDILKSIMTIPNVPMTPDQLYIITLEFGIAGIVIAGIVLGTILGAAFAAIYRFYLKNYSLKLRGIVFGLILWLIGMAINQNGGMGSGIEYFVIFVTGYFVASLVYGYLLGYFFGRFAPKGPRVYEELEWPSVPPSPPTPATKPDGTIQAIDFASFERRSSLTEV